MSEAAPAHLALFVRSLGAAGGGAERSLLNLAGELVRRGHRVDLVLGRAEGHFADAVPEGVRTIAFGVRTPIPVWRAALRDPRTAAALAPALANAHPPWVLGCVPALARYLARERPRALLSVLNYSNLAAIWARDLARVPTRLAISERNTLSVRAAHERRRRLRVLPRLVRRLYPRADAILAVSDGVADDLARVTGLPRERIVATGNPVVTDDLARRAAAPLDHPWLRPGAPPVVLGAGKLKRQKDFATLLRAFATLRRARPARLVVLGEGPERARLEALARELGIAEDVALPGFVAEPFPWMARAAVFALSSAWEGLPGVLIQALACGTPVVSTDCPSGPREILEGGRLGPLVPVGDAEAFAAALGRVLEAPPAPEPLRARAAAFAVGPVTDRYLAALLPGSGDASDPTKAASRSATRS